MKTKLMTIVLVVALSSTMGIVPMTAGKSKKMLLPKTRGLLPKDKAYHVIDPKNIPTSNNKVDCSEYFGQDKRNSELQSLRQKKRLLVFGLYNTCQLRPMKHVVHKERNNPVVPVTGKQQDLVETFLVKYNEPLNKFMWNVAAYPIADLAGIGFGFRGSVGGVSDVALSQLAQGGILGSSFADCIQYGLNEGTGAVEASINPYCCLPLMGKFLWKSYMWGTGTGTILSWYSKEVSDFRLAYLKNIKTNGSIDFTSLVDSVGGVDKLGSMPNNFFNIIG